MPTKVSFSVVIYCAQIFIESVVIAEQKEVSTIPPWLNYELVYIE